MTTTPSSSHISDFRQQKRTDSRADKPDMFPGFDFQIDSPTPSPRKRRRQAYSKLIRLFLQNTRDRLDTIRDVIKDESELHFRLIRPQSEAVIETFGNSMPRNQPIRFLEESNDEQKRQFIDFAFADATKSLENESSDSSANGRSENAAQTYLNSLFAAVGYSRITTTPRPEPSQETFLSRYVFNPLLSVWNSTRNAFFANNGNNVKIVDDDMPSENESASLRADFSNNLNIPKANMRNNVSNSTNIQTSKSNNSLPLIQITTNNVTNVLIANDTIIETNENRVNVSQITLDTVNSSLNASDDQIGGDRKPRNTVPGTAEDAVTAFRGAFLRYSKDAPDSTLLEHSNEYKEDLELQENHSNGLQSSKLIDTTVFSGNLFDDNSTSHIQVVPGKKDITTEFANEITTAASTIDENTETNVKSFGENAGILILEIFGTVIGLTWRAIREIPNYFRSNQN